MPLIQYFTLLGIELPNSPLPSFLARIGHWELQRILLIGYGHLTPLRSRLLPFQPFQSPIFFPLRSTLDSPHLHVIVSLQLRRL